MLTCLLSWLRAFTCSDYGLLPLAGTYIRQAICPLRKELWRNGYLGVEPRRMGSLWLKASEAWEIVLAEGLHDWGRRAVPLFQLYPGICVIAGEWKTGATGRMSKT
jgi:hypothetical protein